MARSVSPSSADVPRTKPLLDSLRLSTLNLQETFEFCLERLRRKEGGYLCFVNVHLLIEAKNSPAVLTALSEALVPAPDGMPLVWLAKQLGTPVGSRVCGPDLTQKLLEATHQDYAHGFIGGAPGVADRVAQIMNVKTAITYSPPFRPFSQENAQEDWREFLKLCPDQKAPPLVWIGLGAPKQELWAAEISHLAPETLFFAIGAAFDFLSGEIQRAPRSFQKLGLEWAWRLSQNPGRLGKRYLKTNSEFLARAAAQLLSNRKP